MLYRLLTKPLLFALKPETAHHLALKTASILGQTPVSAAYTAIYPTTPDPVSCFGLTFKNRLGLAAGFDKDCDAFPFLSAIGFGHIEIGTVTYRAQPGNPKPRMFRLPQDQALINRMGFPSVGAAVVAPKLEKAFKLKNRAILGINIGKSKEVSPEDAIDDYLASYKLLAPWADYVTINVSSPNTPGLRALQQKSFVVDLLKRLRRDGASDKPILVKLAPDLEPDQLKDVLEGCLEASAAGVIATNTTITREGLSTPTAETGGLSGLPLRAKSLEMVRTIHSQCPNLPIIGVGGISSGADARGFVSAGASLVQAYTAFVYQGPALIPNILKALAS